MVWLSIIDVCSGLPRFCATPRNSYRNPKLSIVFHPDVMVVALVPIEVKRYNFAFLHPARYRFP